MKPRITKWCAWYICQLPILEYPLFPTGIGDTPLLAYNDWKARMVSYGLLE